MRRPAVRPLALVALAGALVSTGAAAPPTTAAAPPKVPVAAGYGGAVASVDADASAVGIAVLRSGGNAVDAAVATAAALGVTEPYSAGVGGGGYLVYYDAKSRRVHTIDGRETAPASATATLFQENGVPIPFEEGQTSGRSVGVPGTPATWTSALDAWGSRPLRQLLKPAEELARDGFTVDATFRSQTELNQARFKDFPDTAKLFLPGGALPVVGSTFKNPDLAATYAELGRKGTGALYRGPIAEDIVRAVRTPPVDPAASRKVRSGDLTTRDLRAYETKRQAPTQVSYRGLDVYSMAPSSSGGTTVGEALNILEGTDLGSLSEAQYLHRFIEASRISFADRGRWVGDPAAVDVPTRQLLSQRYADSRACLISPDRALTSPLAPGDPRRPQPCATTGRAAPTTYEGENTTHLTVADRWGNVVSYTLTIESTGGSAITVPGRGFLLNNELTDFSFAPAAPGVPDPNLPGPGKRPRSSMSPTIVLDDGRPVLAVGSPGGATIITTVLQTLIGHLDRGLPLVDAIAAPRASQRNQTTTELEPGLWNSPVRAELEALGQGFRQNPEIGAATGVQRLPDGRWLAAAETSRRGGGSAMVVRPYGRP
ncbi:gamma-glutamyltransferase [Streptomyces goshikiensis]|uniref:Glutathione hydrolase proenzyme n=1 Tax=Streptomyces goshikiensis TaxID=1942 RepID=A0ABZ1RHB0_9ACTN|nr:MULTISPECIES: gamma-glutamyltransferase [Streptomyces]MBP0937051.1 gamma-glutamyltransferase [Streptomyces sp. KCTC 0041BP]OKI39890.1 gamma-glutamyltransferase [Streptomyces sp. CB03578]PJN20659.1 gamma-glutamyltransferase [Streptomyces sp. CB02120-2]GHD61537.1 gamma-glutamyltranspeptidase [Streptomyces goshikiensis]